MIIHTKKKEEEKRQITKYELCSEKVKSRTHVIPFMRMYSLIHTFYLNLRERKKFMRKNIMVCV